MKSARELLESPEVWGTKSLVADFLAEELASNRLSLVLGAGVSAACGLPEWRPLVQRSIELSGAVGLSVVDQGPEVSSERLLVEHFGGDAVAFSAVVRKALYENFDGSTRALLRTPILTSLSALIAGMAKGRLRGVVSFNFDDLFERCLESLGVCVNVVDSINWKRGPYDIESFHPHGLLPFDSGKRATPIVFVEKDFDRLFGGAALSLRDEVLGLLRTTTPLFIGLSGRDANLRGMLASCEARASSGLPRWGVRVCKKGNHENPTWESRGVCCVELDAHPETASFVDAIVKKAASLRLR